MDAISGQSVKQGWALVLGKSDAAALQSLRLRPGLTVLEREDGEHLDAPRVDAPCAVEHHEVWLRGDELDDLKNPAIRALPALRRFTIGADDSLMPVDRYVPDGVLPSGIWAPLDEWFKVQAPRAALAGWLTCRTPLRLVRGGVIADANLLMVDATAWHAFGEHASVLRLRPLSFAMDRQGSVLVRGEPLPPLPGTPYILKQRIALPVGYTFADHLTRDEVVHMLDLPAETFALFGPDARWSRLAESDFVTASRTAIRMNVDDQSVTAAPPEDR